MIDSIKLETVTKKAIKEIAKKYYPSATQFKKIRDEGMIIVRFFDNDKTLVGKMIKDMYNNSKNKCSLHN